MPTNINKTISVSPVVTAIDLFTYRVDHGLSANGATTIAARGAAPESQDSSRGIRSVGDPYFAAWMQHPGAFFEIGGGEQSVEVVMGVNAAPPRRSSNDEVNWFWSYHEIDGQELFSMGVTPDLRLAGRAVGIGTIYSQSGMVQADGVAREYTIFTPGNTGIQLEVDGLVVAAALDLNAPTGLFGDGLHPTRVMMFNGLDAASRLDCTIFRARISPENNAVLWPFGTPTNYDISGYEVDGDDNPIDPALDDYPGSDFTLTMGYFDPRPSAPLLYGVPPGSPPAPSFRRVLNTQFTARRVVKPTYVARIG